MILKADYIFIRKDKHMPNVEDVNWRLLKTCYGIATEIPKWLKQLASSDLVIRQKAFEQLTDQIYHQGTVYEATPYVVPFLIDLLSNPLVQDKENILDLLWIVELAQPPMAEQEVALSILYVESAKEEIRKGLPVYLSLLDNESPKVKTETARLLSELRQDARSILPRLLAHIQMESDEDTAATLIWAMGKLLEDNSDISSHEKSQIVVFLSKLATSAESILVRFAASVSLLKAVGNDASQEVVEFVIDVASQPEADLELPWLDVVLWTACDALAELHGEKRISAFEKLLTKCDSVQNVHDVVITLLNRVFRGKHAKRQDLGIGYNRTRAGTEEWNYTTNYKVNPVQKLTQEQEAVVRIILESEKFWEIRNNLFDAYGLPASRDELQQFLIDISAK